MGAEISKELADANPAWATMLEKVRTVQTQAYQLWLNKNLEELGWIYGSESPVLGTYVELIDTYADMSQLIAPENMPPVIRVPFSPVPVKFRLPSTFRIRMPAKPASVSETGPLKLTVASVPILSMSMVAPFEPVTAPLMLTVQASKGRPKRSWF